MRWSANNLPGAASAPAAVATAQAFPGAADSGSGILKAMFLAT